MYRKFVKRMLDILFASTFVALLFLPLALLGIWIKLDSHGPILFKQKRAGKDLVPFTVYKFRSMTTDAPKNSPTNSLSNASTYITRSGKILRKLSLDELPQLLNVLKGEMSIVGPRPVVLNETDLLSRREKYRANSCKPGITGWAQVNGRDELRVHQKAKMDGEYVKHFGAFMDAKCLFMTIWAVLSVSGHKEGHEVQDTYEEVPSQRNVTRYNAEEGN